MFWCTSTGTPTWHLDRMFYQKQLYFSTYSSQKGPWGWVLIGGVLLNQNVCHIKVASFWHLLDPALSHDALRCLIKLHQNRSQSGVEKEAFHFWLLCFNEKMLSSPHQTGHTAAASHRLASCGHEEPRQGIEIMHIAHNMSAFSANFFEMF